MSPGSPIALFLFFRLALKPFNPEGLVEVMKRVLHAVQPAVPMGIITRPNIAAS